MRIDLPATEAWTAVSDQYRAALPFSDSAVHVQIYPGYQTALLELCQGLAKLYSHKRTIAYIGKTDPAFETVAVPFSEDEFTIKSLTADDVQNPESWLPALEKDLLLVLIAEDDPITGRLHQNSKLLEALKEKRVFRVVVSHAAHRENAISRPAPFDVRILSLTPERSLLVAGERCRITPTFTLLLPWALVDLETAKSEVETCPQSTITDWRERVQAFEKDLPPGFQPFFKPGESRLFDRAVITTTKMDGYSVITEVGERLGIRLSPPGQPTALESTSPCRWANPRFAEWLIQGGLSEDVVRGTIMIEANSLGASTKDALAQASEKIHKMQNG